MELKSILFSAFVVLLMSLSAESVAGGKKKFGVFGSTGSHGHDGRPGDNGRSVEAKANGSQTTFMLSGGDGGHGSYGQDGGDAYGCEQPYRPDRNLRAASGGDGGDGGDGGKGGDGGNVTLLYSDLAQLKKVSVISAGGRGGDGADGGRGGRACACYTENWSVRVCNDEKDKNGNVRNVCKNNEHFCQSGKHGDQGSRGRRGRAGDDGTIFLVKGQTDWQADVLSKSVSLESAVNASFTLGEHLFEPKSGATQLLAPGSIVSNEYYQYASTEYANLSLEWQSPRSPQDFIGVRLELTKQGSEVHHEIEGSLVDFEQTGTTDKKLTIKNIVLRREARAIDFSIDADGPNTVIVVEDKSNSTDILKNKFSLQFYNKSLFSWKKRLDRVLSDDEWQRVDNTLVINLGDLGLKKKFIKKGKKVKVNIALKRSLGDDFEIIEYSDKLKI